MKVEENELNELIQRYNEINEINIELNKLLTILYKDTRNKVDMMLDYLDNHERLRNKSLVEKYNDQLRELTNNLIKELVDEKSVASQLIRNSLIELVEQNTLMSL